MGTEGRCEALVRAADSGLQRPVGLAVLILPNQRSFNHLKMNHLEMMKVVESKTRVKFAALWGAQDESSSASFLE